MATDFSAPSWLFPKEGAWESFVKGSQAGAAIAANRIRAAQFLDQGSPGGVPQLNRSLLVSCHERASLVHEGKTLRTERARSRSHFHLHADAAARRDWRIARDA